MAGVETLDLRFHLLISFPVQPFPVIHSRLKAKRKQMGQAQHDLRVLVEGPLDFSQVIEVRAGVGQVGVTESNHRIAQRRLLPGHHPVDEKIRIHAAGIGEDLAVVQLGLQLVVQRGIFHNQLTLTGGDVKGSQEIWGYAIADVQSVCPPHPNVQTVKNLHDLGQKAAFRRVADGKQKPRLLVAGHVDAVLHVQVKAVVIADFLVEPDDPGHPFGRRNADVSLIVQPQETENLVKITEGKVSIAVGHHLDHRVLELPGNAHPAGGGNFLMGFAVKLKPLDFQGAVGTGNRVVGMADLGVGNLFFLQLHEGLMQGAGIAEAGLDQLALLVGHHQPPVAGHRMQAADQVGQGIVLPGHGNEKIRVEILLQPVEIHLPLAAAFIKDLLNFPIHFFFQSF